MPDLFQTLNISISGINNPNNSEFVILHACAWRAPFLKGSRTQNAWDCFAVSAVFGIITVVSSCERIPRGM